MAKAAFDACAGTYDAALSRGLSLSGESKDYFIRARIDWLASRLDQQGHRPGRILDYGCGTGDASRVLLDRLSAASVTGVDVSGESIELARRRHADDRVRFGTIDDMTACGGHDLVYCNGVFHHIEPARRPEALVYIRRSLVSGGYFAFWENNPWNPGTRLVMRRIEFDRDAQLLSAPHARRMLEAAGFDVVHTDFRFFFPRALSALRPLEAPLTRVPAGAQYLILGRKRA